MVNHLKSMEKISYLSRVFSSHLIRNSPELKYFHLVLFVWSNKAGPTCTSGEEGNSRTFTGCNAILQSETASTFQLPHTGKKRVVAIKQNATSSPVKKWFAALHRREKLLTKFLLWKLVLTPHLRIKWSLANQPRQYPTSCCAWRRSPHSNSSSAKWRKTTGVLGGAFLLLFFSVFRQTHTAHGHTHTKTHTAH